MPKKTSKQSQGRRIKKNKLGKRRPQFSNPSVPLPRRKKASEENENLLQLIGFLIDECSEDKYLTDEHLFALIYLADWHHVLQYQKTITGATWQRKKFGPESNVLSHARNDSRFGFREGDDKQKGIVSWKSIENSFNIDGFLKTEQDSIRHIISEFGMLPQDELDEIVYGTAPMLGVGLGIDIDLPSIAEKHKREKDLPPWHAVLLR